VWIRSCAFKCELFVYTLSQPGYLQSCTRRFSKSGSLFRCLFTGCLYWWLLVT